jgi:hypothetical protein
MSDEEIRPDEEDVEAHFPSRDAATDATPSRDAQGDEEPDVEAHFPSRDYPSRDVPTRDTPSRD